MAQPGADQHEGRVSIREGPNHAGPAADLPVQPLDHIVGADPGPMLIGEITVGQGFLNTVFHLFGGFFQLHCLQFGHHSFRFFTGSLLTLLSVDRLMHLGNQFHLGTRNDGKHIPVKMHCAPLVFGVRKHFSHGFQHSQTLVSDNKLYAIQATAFESLKEIHPTGLIFFHTFSSA